MYEVPMSIDIGYFLFQFKRVQLRNVNDKSKNNLYFSKRKKG